MTIATPPPVAVGILWELLLLGTSTKPNILENFLIRKVIDKDKTKTTRNMNKYCTRRPAFT